MISFADESSGRNLGCCIVESEPMASIFVAKDKGINPGGQAKMYKLTEEEYKDQGLELDRLYTRKEMKELGFGF